MECLGAGLLSEGLMLIEVIIATEGEDQTERVESCRNLAGVPVGVSFLLALRFVLHIHSARAEARDVFSRLRAQ